MSGSKTYIICAVAIVYAVFGVLSGNLDAASAVNVVLAALGAAGLRHAISTTSTQ